VAVVEQTNQMMLTAVPVVLAVVELALPVTHMQPFQGCQILVAVVAETIMVELAELVV
jgi:hypothetical protein